MSCCGTTAGDSASRPAMQQPVNPELTIPATN
jgi:hypothetical protein